MTGRFFAAVTFLLVVCASGAPFFAQRLTGNSTACCSWDKCGDCGKTTPYCESTETACTTDCGGQWCPNGAQGPSGYLMPTVCDPKASSAKTVAYACMDWSVGSGAMLQAAAAEGLNSTHFFGVGSFGTGGSNMGKCYEVELAGLQVKGLLQVVNQGGDVTSGQFDLQMGDGGLGLYNGCVAPIVSGHAPMFSGDKSSFGKQYGGWGNKEDCARLPEKPQALSSLPAGEPSLPRLCELGFEMGLRKEGGENTAITAMKRVVCPKSLVALTGLDRTDGTESETHAKGILTRMMDCCKPSAGWTANIEKPDPHHPAVVPCTADGLSLIHI